MSDSAKFEEIRRRQIGEARAHTAQAVERLGWTRERVLEEQTRRLRHIVAEARLRSPFHAEGLAAIDPDSLDAADLTALPVTTKQDVMDHWDQMVTDDRLRLDDVNRHLVELHEGRSRNPYYLDEYLVVATGGSSGRRGVFLWDHETMVVMPNLVYRMEVAADRASPPAGGRRTAVICAGSLVHGSRHLFPIMLDPERDCRVIAAGMPVDEMVRELNAYRPDRIIGYSSLVEEMAHQAIRGALTIEPTGISTNSEPLFPEARAAVREAWGIGVHDGWGSVEIGFAAAEGESFGGMTLAEDYCIFEAVDAERRPVADASQADRLLVTKLYGSVLPIIRYEIMDAAVIDDGPNPDASGYRRIREIKGRSDAWFVYEGDVKIHPMTFRGVLGQSRAIGEYQVRQTASGADIKVIAHGELDIGETERALEAALAAAGLRDARVTVEPVSSLPRHPQTNKLTAFVPLDRRTS